MYEGRVETIKVLHDIPYTMFLDVKPMRKFLTAVDWRIELVDEDLESLRSFSTPSDVLMKRE
jgi:hypothetical protein